MTSDTGKINTESTVTIETCLSSKILEIFKKEIEKTDTKQKIKNVLDPISLYFLSTFQPYVNMVIIMLLLIMILQIFLIIKIHMMHKI